MDGLTWEDVCLKIPVVKKPKCMDQVCKYKIKNTKCQFNWKFHSSPLLTHSSGNVAGADEDEVSRNRGSLEVWTKEKAPD